METQNNKEKALIIKERKVPNANLDQISENEFRLVFDESETINHISMVKAKINAIDEIDTVTFEDYNGFPVIHFSFDKEAKEIYQEFKDGKILNTKELMILQKSGYL